VYLDPELTHGPLRRPVELCDQAVQALVPARAVAHGLAELIEAVAGLTNEPQRRPPGARRRSPGVTILELFTKAAQ